MRLLIYAAAAILFVSTMSIIGNMEKADAEAERELYCEMVETYHETGGEYGWPPYKGECEE